MVMTLRGCTLDWYMDFSVVSMGSPQKSSNHVQVKLIDEFKKPKFESQCITELKEIKKSPSESVWDFD